MSSELISGNLSLIKFLNLSFQILISLGICNSWKCIRYFSNLFLMLWNLNWKNCNKYKLTFSKVFLYPTCPSRIFLNLLKIISNFLRTRILKWNRSHIIQVPTVVTDRPEDVVGWIVSPQIAFASCRPAQQSKSYLKIKICLKRLISLKHTFRGGFRSTKRWLGLTIWKQLHKN